MGVDVYVCDVYVCREVSVCVCSFYPFLTCCFHPICYSAAQGAKVSTATVGVDGILLVRLK